MLTIVAILTLHPSRTNLALSEFFKFSDEIILPRHNNPNY